MNYMESKNGFVAIVGLPNVGKSSLINSLMGQKISIVSSKPQTTRTRILGVLTRNETQLVFIDTPGILTPKTELGKYMEKSIFSSVSSVDIALLVVDANRSIKNEELKLLGKLKTIKIPIILAINKIDLINDKTLLLKKLTEFSKLYDFKAIVPISAKKKDGLNSLLDELVSLAIPGIHFFDDDTLTDQPEKVIVAEIIREKILRLIDKEIPHGIAVAIESMKERQNKSLMDISAVIYCDKENHKKIIIGKNGNMLKNIGSKARKDIEMFLDIKINLNLWVKVKENWKNKITLLKNFGYDSRNLE